MEELKNKINQDLNFGGENYLDDFCITPQKDFVPEQLNWEEEDKEEEIAKKPTKKISSFWKLNKTKGK